MTTESDCYIRFDWAIKRLLRQKANFAVLEGFLTVLLDEPIRILEILESESNRDDKDDKSNRVDIKARNSKDQIVLIEIQNNRERYYLERILYGVSKAVTEHIGRGEGYDHVKKVYSISILYFDLGQGEDYLYHGRTDFIGVHTHDHLKLTVRDKDAILPYLPADVFPEYYLIRVNEFDKVAVTPLEEWIEYLKYGKIKEDTTAPGLDAVREHLQYFSLDKAEQKAYDRYCDNLRIENDVMTTARQDGWQEGWEQGKDAGLQEGHEKGLQEGHEKGLKEGHEKGLQEAALAMARKLKASGMPLSQIAEITGLDTPSLEKLNESLDNTPELDERRP